MCGFVAIYSYRPAAPSVDLHELRLIRDHMSARGPDGLGEWLSADRRIGLASRRLAIIDPSPAGDQPMSSQDGRLVIAFNGEIYNYAELRERLTAQGRAFRSHCDTEVLLNLFEQHGSEMVSELRGMFAFAIWDHHERTLFLARDPYGIKPLYYADNGSTIRVASQVKALLAGGAVSKAIDPAGAVGFHLTGSVPEPFTIRHQVRALPAGTTMLIREGGSAGAQKRYFSIAATYREAKADTVAQPPAAGRTAEPAGPHRDFREALLESVRYHLVSDVPVGAFLSSGIDSASIVGLARDAGANDLQTITLGFEEYRGSHDDEGPLAEAVARLYGTRHTTRVVTAGEFDADMKKVLDTMDQPTIDGVNTWFVSKATAEQGLKVALSGLGGDELLGSYPSFSEIPRLVRIAGLVSRVPLLPELFRIVWSTFGFNGRKQKTAGLLRYGGTYPGAYFLKRALFMPWELDNLLGRDVAREGLQQLSLLDLIGRQLDPDPVHPYARVATLESSLYMRNQLLRDTDWASMAHSLEVRVPLVDSFLLRRLAPMVVNMDSSAKQQLGLTPAVPVPSEVRHRVKTGFTVPLQHWLSRLGAGKSAETPMRRWARHVFEAATAR